MKAAVFDYVAPRSLGEAVKAIASSDGAKLIAGGQSLGPMLNLRLARPRLLVDISRIDALQQIESRRDSLWIGAATTHARLEDEADGMLQAVAGGIAYRSVRNRGTIGGSMAHADPAADWPLARNAGRQHPYPWRKRFASSSCCRVHGWRIHDHPR
jgi:carbon-monoxide dehydrogenase medium subunit